MAPPPLVDNLMQHCRQNLRLRCEHGSPAVLAYSSAHLPSAIVMHSLYQSPSVLHEAWEHSVSLILTILPGSFAVGILREQSCCQY